MFVTVPVWRSDYTSVSIKILEASGKELDVKRTETSWLEKEIPAPTAGWAGVAGTACRRVSRR